ncbi:CvpA family protein [Mucilaginibacter sp. Bleaf8]|uniref:CvpA family protein n=1 Tax=Mucilaginibacter sp. Bleaf8 TaxID=2834430 RepID=UPI001BCD65ED|nr:CvpA family protein [Mucilaginibacter sp. Bleaf8]MBS7564426.1 CvpA family protein [Mucilaginibacter sp. Bleaf8]
MNLIDIVLVLIVGLSVWMSIQRGFIVAGLELLVWVGSLLVGFIAYSPLAALIRMVVPSLGVWVAPLAFIVAVTLCRLLLVYLVDKLLSKTPDRVHENAANKALGFIPGLINGLIWAALAGTFLLLLPVTAPVFNRMRDGGLANKLVVGVSWAENKLAPIFGDALNHAVPKMTAEVDNERTVKLPYSVKDAKVRTDLESQMLELVNNERLSRGLLPLKADPKLAVVARKHSADMFARSYFSHYTPENLDPFDRMKRDGVQFLTAGENLAVAQTLSIAHTGLMNSPGHRANILNAAFSRVGIGVLDGGIYGLMITQNFRN